MLLRQNAPVVEAPRPRLVVLLSIDQFRADYVVRFSDLYLPGRSGDRVGGFNYFRQFGAWYPDCRYEHHRTVTAVGHSILGTGAQPQYSGIVGNTWADPATLKRVYCVDDPNSKVIGLQPGSKETPMSAANLQVTTTAYELEVATGGEAKTCALALKDRAAILLVGHKADAAVWFDEETGGWVSSTPYCPDGKLPAWVDALNARKRPDELRQTPWTPAVSDEAMNRVRLVPGEKKKFSHELKGADYLPFAGSPAGNQYLFESATEAVKQMGLGQDDTPDMLCLNLSSNDYVGHRYGPDSAEVLDISVQTDRQLSEFMNFLAKTVPGGLSRVTFAISADHGVVPVPELQTAAGLPVERALSVAIAAAADGALDKAVGAEMWIGSGENGDLYFNNTAVAAHPEVERARMQQIAAQAVRSVTGMLFAVGREDVLRGNVPRNSLGARITNGVHPNRSGDVILILKPQWFPGGARTGSGTSHGSPFADDTHVPMLVAGAGFQPGTYTAPVGPAWLAPSLSHVLRVARPSGSDTPLLPGLVGATR